MAGVVQAGGGGGAGGWMEAPIRTSLKSPQALWQSIWTASYSVGALAAIVTVKS
jgi:hypothetical protein